MRRYMIFIGAGMVLAASTLFAQNPGSEIIRSVAGDMDFYVTNNGIFGRSPITGNPGLVYPRGSEQGYLFGSGLWFGGRKLVDGELKKVMFLTYNPASGTGWATPGEYLTGSDDPRPKIYNSVEYSPVSGEFIGGPDPHPSWPLWLRPGMQATPMRAGIFEPSNSRRESGGDYARPAMVGGVEEEFVARFHDSSLGRYEVLSPEERAGAPMGLGIQQVIYSFVSDPYRPVVIIQYQIVNHSSDTLFNCLAAQASDPDLGDTGNDHLRFYAEHPELRTAFAWTEDEGTGHGVLAMSLIEAPVTGAAGFIDNSRRHDYKLAGRVGAFPDWTRQNDPRGFSLRYDFMSESIFTDDTGPGEKLALMTSTPFSMRPGDTAYFTVAYAVLDSLPAAGKARRGDSRRLARGMTQQDEYRRLLESLLDDYYDRETFSTISLTATDPEPETGLAVAAMPNPVRDRAMIRLTFGGRTNALLRIVNALGQTVMVRRLGARPAGVYDEQIDATGLPTGLYFAMVEATGRVCTTRFAVAR